VGSTTLAERLAASRRGEELLTASTIAVLSKKRSRPWQESLWQPGIVALSFLAYR
jgi:hypothetical protein